jgi:hypothetical protein
MLRTIRRTRKGAEILERWEFFEEEAADRQDREYVMWLSRRHPRQVLGEVVSNGFALLVEFILQQHREMEGAETEETEEHTEDSKDQVISTLAPEVLLMGLLSGHGGNSNMHSLESDEIVRQWARGCIVCRARGRGRTDHV